MVAPDQLRARDRERDRPTAHPVEGNEDAVEHQRERERREREVDPAEPERGDGQQRADHRGEHGADEHRQQRRAGPALATSWAVANPPTAAKVAWQSEICPAMPVITVIDRKITPKTTAFVTIRSQKSSSENIASATPSRTTASAEHAGRDGQALATNGRGKSRRRRVHARERVGGLPLLTQPGPEQQQEEKEHERQRRSEAVGQDAVEREVAGEDSLEDAEQQPAQQRHRNAREPGERRRRDRRDEQDGEVRGRQLREQRRDQDAGEPREQAGEHPGERARHDRG